MSLLESLLNQQYGVVLSDEMMDMDWKETPDAHIFEIDIPGVTKEDVKVELVHDESRILHISVERKEEEEKGGSNKWHCRERARGGRLMRQFRLPDNAKVDEIKALMRDGVLTITVPINKDQLKKKKKHKSVQINSDGDGDHAHAPKGLGRFVCCKA